MSSVHRKYRALEKVKEESKINLKAHEFNEKKRVAKELRKQMKKKI